MTQDDEHLRLLSIFHYIGGGLMGLGAFLPVVHLIVGLLFIFAPHRMGSEGPPAPALFGLTFVIFAGVFIVAGLICAGLVIAAGRFLASRRHYLFCLVIAAIECTFFPLGTALGVFTIIVLSRESVKQSFAGAPG